MSLWDQPPEDVRPVLIEERAALLSLLADLSDQDWVAPTAVPGWRVKDLALHLLDDDLGWLSRGRDHDRSGRLHPDDTDFVAALAEKNQRWVDGAQGLSRQVVTGLLGWAGHQMDAYYAQMNLLEEGGVVWADDKPVPVWFDIAQDLTERWVHQQQMREPLGRLDDYADRYLPIVLRTFVWAFPHQYRPQAAEGTEVEIVLGDAGTWTLVATGGGRWRLSHQPARNAAARLSCTLDAAWRLFTGAHYEASEVTVEGPVDLAEPLLTVRGIIV